MCDQHDTVAGALKCGYPVSQESPRLPRKKLWDLDSIYHCSVIGTCLSLAELRQIARKAGIPNPNACNDYELHRLFVSGAKTASSASRLVQKHLERKFARTIDRLAKTLSTGALRDFWREALDSGEIAPAYWALLTFPNPPYSLMDEVYGDVHMLSHLSGATVRVDLQELKTLRRRNRELQQHFADVQMDARRRLTEQQKTIDGLNRRLANHQEVTRELDETRASLSALEADPLIASLRGELMTLSARLAAEQERAERADQAAEKWRQQADQLAVHCQRYEQQVEALGRERDALEATLTGLLAAMDMVEDESPDLAAKTDLCGRCILYVGGRQGLCGHFRQLVERRNGRFIHHDGGQEDARAQLWDVLQQADAVLCPLDCVSHDAVRRVKRFCERATKPLVLLPRASLSAFTSGLNAVAV